VGDYFFGKVFFKGGVGAGEVVDLDGGFVAVEAGDYGDVGGVAVACLVDD